MNKGVEVLATFVYILWSCNCNCAGKVAAQALIAGGQRVLDELLWLKLSCIYTYKAPLKWGAAALQFSARFEALAALWALQVQVKAMTSPAISLIASA